MPQHSLVSFQSTGKSVLIYRKVYSQKLVLTISQRYLLRCTVHSGWTIWAAPSTTHRHTGKWSNLFVQVYRYWDIWFQSIYGLEHIAVLLPYKYNLKVHIFIKVAPFRSVLTRALADVQLLYRNAPLKLWMKTSLRHCTPDWKYYEEPPIDTRYPARTWMYLRNGISATTT